MKKYSDAVVLQPHNHSVRLGDKCSELQWKSWQVLILLTERAPGVVSRQEIIEEVWGGNFPVGNKGLNQALWAIRIALGDNARRPRYIRTLARLGYQWIHLPPKMTQSQSTTTRRHWASVAAISAVAVSIGWAVWQSGPSALPVRNSMAAAVSVAADGTRAYLRGQRIVVDMPAGRQRIVAADESDVRIGSPILSADGKQIVFPVRKAQECKIVQMELETGARTDFGGCPAWSI